MGGALTSCSSAAGPPEEVVMFARFWKEGCQEGLDAGRLEDSSTEQPEVRRG